MSEHTVHHPDDGIVMLSLVSDRRTLTVPQALIDDKPAFRFMLIHAGGPE